MNIENTKFLIEVYFLPFRRHYRPRKPRFMQSSIDITLAHDDSILDECVKDVAIEKQEHNDIQDYQPSRKIRRTFSTQPTSTFTLNSSLSNGVHQNSDCTDDISPVERDKNDVITNGPTVSNNNSSLLWKGNSSASRNTFSTAPVKAVYALNFPSTTTNINLTNNVLKGNNKIGALSNSRIPVTSRLSINRHGQTNNVLNRR